MALDNILDSAYALISFVERGSISRVNTNYIDELFAVSLKVEEFHSTLGSNRDAFEVKLESLAESKGERMPECELSRVGDLLLGKFIDPSVDEYKLSVAIQRYLTHFGQDRFRDVVGLLMGRRRIWVALSRIMGQLSGTTEIEADLLEATWVKGSEDEVQKKVREMLEDGVCDILLCVLMGENTAVKTAVLNEMSLTFDSKPELNVWIKLLKCQQMKDCASQFEPLLELIFKIIDFIGHDDYNEILEILVILDQTCKIRKYLRKYCCLGLKKEIWRHLMTDLNGRLSKVSGH